MTVVLSFLRLSLFSSWNRADFRGPAQAIVYHPDTGIFVS